MFYLILAILTEVAGTTTIMLSEEFTRLVPSVAIFDTAHRAAHRQPETESTMAGERRSF